MSQNDILHGTLLEETTFTCDELARACYVEPQWIIEHIETGTLGDGSTYIDTYRFTSYDLKRARRIRQLEQDFDAVPELAAMVVDLMEEVERLKKQLKPE